MSQSVRSLAGKTALVTGGAGFVGSHIVDLLIGEGCSEVIALDNFVRGTPGNLADAQARGRVWLVEGDVRNFRLMDTLLRRSDIVFHQAALRITHCVAEPRAAMEVMVDATFDLLEGCIKHDIERLVFASSASIYGMAEVFPTPESHHGYANRTLYGAAKSFNEGLLRAFNDMHRLDYVALRYFNVYGPRMDTHGKYTEVMIRWMERIEAGEAPVIFGTGAQTMDFVHVRDVARANILAAQAPVGDAVFNVGTGTETSLQELASLLAGAMGRPDIAPEHGPERTVNAVPRRLADTGRARTSLGFEAEIGLEAGLRDLAAWWRGQHGPATARVAVAG
jgi:UDP-glucose 4-epimerase